MQDYSIAYDFIQGLTGDAVNAIVDFRAIHELDKGVPAPTNRGTLAQCWDWCVSWNNAGYGIHFVVSQMDGMGRELQNVSYIRAHYIDLDNLFTSFVNAEKALASNPSPAMIVNSSPGKFHVYWTVKPYQDNNYCSTIQRKLYTLYDGDHEVNNAARTSRLPGTLHLKNPLAPHLVTMNRCHGYGYQIDVTALYGALENVVVLDHGGGVRHDLGDPQLAAPSMDWLQYAMDRIDPNMLDRGEWIALTSAIKQAGWTLATGDALFERWSNWCARYDKNDLAENLKQWNSIRNTQLGWHSIKTRCPAVVAAMMHQNRPVLTEHVQGVPVPPPVAPGGVVPLPPVIDETETASEFLTADEQRTYFKDCVFVVSRGDMLIASGRFVGPSTFNATYGGKNFTLNAIGKSTDEPWKAATRSTQWQVPKVDHTRFLPDLTPRITIRDDQDRLGINVYKPAIIRRVAGDATPFIWHLQQLLPVPGDFKTIMDYLAHNIKYPGFKIPWAPVIQSTEGAGKGLLKYIMTHCMGRSMVYFPNAKELTNSGSQFNAWMRHKLFILADEIKVDDRRDLIEVLKPMISEEIIEVQGKGVDQGLEDNFANWCFFTNYKDAIPISKNGRRYSVMYSALQTADDMLHRQMHENYFKRLYDWAKADGGAIMYDYFLNYALERGSIPMRGPDTSSTIAAIELSRSPVENLILEAVSEGMAGFKNGWVSVQSVIKRSKATAAVRTLAPHTVCAVLETLGYVACGRSVRAYFQEDKDVKPLLYKYGAAADVNAFGPSQGWQ